MDVLIAACLVTCKTSDTELITDVECQEQIQATNWKIRILNFTCWKPVYRMEFSKIE